MRVLMVSPHPTYSPRGTPISVLNRCRALCALGHTVDLVTYGIGQDVPVRGLRYLRAPVPGLTSVKVGPSLAKLPLDAAVFATSLRLLATRRRTYDVLHTHEEAGVLGLAPFRHRLPHVYDMGNDLEVVLRNYGFSPGNPLTRGAALLEGAVVRHADAVIAHFPAIAAKVVRVGKGAVPVQVVPNIPLEPAPEVLLEHRVRARWSRDGLPLAVYAGTLESYQGLPMMVGALAVLRGQGTDVRMLIVGGREEQRLGLETLARERGVADLVNAVGVVPQDDVPSYLRAADVVLSPRAAGSNTPLKVFSYLRCGRPILATRILSHTQILDDGCALLVDPNEAALAAGLRTLVSDPARASALSSTAARMAVERYDTRAYVRAVAAAYESVGAGHASESQLDDAVADVDRDVRYRRVA